MQPLGNQQFIVFYMPRGQKATACVGFYKNFTLTVSNWSRTLQSVWCTVLKCNVVSGKLQRSMISGSPTIGLQLCGKDQPGGTGLCRLCVISSQGNCTHILAYPAPLRRLKLVFNVKITTTHQMLSYGNFLKIPQINFVWRLASSTVGQDCRQMPGVLPWSPLYEAWQDNMNIG